MKQKRIVQKKTDKLSLCPDTSSEQDGRKPFPSAQVSGLFVKERGSWCGSEDDNSSEELERFQEAEDDHLAGESS